MKTDDYLKAIDDRRTAGKPVSVDFSQLPDGVDTLQVAQKLADGLPRAYAQEVLARHDARKPIKLDYGAIREAGLPPATVRAAKDAGQLIGHALRLGSGLISDVTEKGVGALGEDAAAVTKRGAGLSAEPLPNVESPGIIDRITKSALAAEKQLKTPPSEQERTDHPIATALHLTRPLRALGAVIDESLPEYSAYAKWEARSKLGSLKAKIDDVVAHGQRKDYAAARAIAPVEDAPQSMGRIALRAGIETASDLAAALGDFVGSFTTPSGFVANELMMKGAGKAGGYALEGAVRAAPEAVLKAVLPVTSEDMGAAIKTGARPHAWEAADRAVMQNVSRNLSGISEKLGAEASPRDLQAAVADASKRSYEVLARRALGLKLRGTMTAMESDPEARPSEGPKLLTTDSKEGGAPPEPRPMPIDPDHIASTVIGAGVDGPDAQALASKFPYVYSSAADLADVPPAARARYQSWADGIARSLNLPEGTKIDADALAFAVKTGKANYIQLADLNKTLFEAEAQAQGAHPDTMARLWADAQTAAAQPAETLVVHHAGEQAKSDFKAARARAEEITRHEAVRVAGGHDVAPTASDGPEAASVPGKPGAEAASAPLPGRTEGLAQAAEAGVPLPEAHEAHREAALAAQEAGTLDPEVAAEYADQGDDSFDPAALEAEARTMPDLAPHPAEMDLAAFRAAFPDADPAVHAALVEEAKAQQVEAAREDLKEDLRRSDVRAQPVHDYLKKHPIGEKWIKALGLSGEFRDMKARGVTTKETGDETKVDYRVRGLIDAGALPEGATWHDMVDALEAESRGGGKSEAQAALVRDADEVPDARYIGSQKEPGRPDLPLYNITKPGHPQIGSTVTANTLKELGLKVPKETPDVVRDAPVPPFYAKLTRDVEAKLGKSATIEQVRGLLRDQKAEEVSWSGIEDFLQGKEKVTKAEVLEYLRANQLEIKEVLKTDGGDRREGEIRVIQDGIERDFLAAGYEITVDPVGMPGEVLVVKKGTNDPVEAGKLSKDLREKAEQYADLDKEIDEIGMGVVKSGDAKFGDYQLTGGSNYREMLLTIPSEREGIQRQIDELVEKQDAARANRDLYPPNSEKWKKFQAEMDEHYKAGNSLIDSKPKVNDFRSTHFDEPNILAHVRFNDRVDSESARVLFLEEVQSDWHQKGRREGYKGDVSPEDKKALEVANAEADRLNKIRGAEYDRVKSSHKSAVGFGDALMNDKRYTKANADWEVAVEARTSAEQKAMAFHGVPDAPLKKTWHEFALKRMLRYAAEHGYDKVGWTTGEQQADRYDLSKQVQSVHYRKEDDGTFDVWATGKDGRNVEIGNHNAARLPDVVGKDLAAKIVAGAGDLEKKPSRPGTTGTRTISGLDLKVGGEGMKGFYDQMIPSFLNKFGKKYGAKVGETTIRTADMEVDPYQTENFQGVTKPAEDVRVHAFPITPALRDAAINEGFSLFDAANENNVMAYGPRADLALIAQGVQLDLQLGGAGQAAAQFGAEGRVDYVGKDLKSWQDAAEIVASMRHTMLEHQHFILTRKGKIVAHKVITSGLPNAVLITPEQVSDIKRLADQLGADEIRDGHNHPSGNPSPSIQDKEHGQRMAREFGPRYKGAVVTDHDEFSLISPSAERDASVDRHAFATTQPQYAAPKSYPLYSAADLSAQAFKESFDGKSHIVLYMDARRQLIGAEHVEMDDHVPSRVKEGVLRYKASHAAVVSTRSNFRPQELPFEAQDVVHIGPQGDIEPTPPGWQFRQRGPSAHGPVMRSTYVQDEPAPEPVPRYMGGQGMDKDDFARALEESKIEKGSTVTARISFEGIPRGMKLKVIAVDRAGVRLIVQPTEGVRFIVTRPENLVETYRKPAAREALEAAQAMEGKSGTPSQPIKKTIEEQQDGLAQKERITQTVRQALNARLRAESYAARVAARKTKADLTAQFRRRFDDLKVDFSEQKEALKAKYEAQKASVEWAKGEITKYIKENLPVSARGKFLDMVRTADSPMDVEDAFLRVDAEAALLYKKGLIDDINKLVLRASDSPSIAIEDKKMMRAFMDELTSGRENLSQRMREVDDYFGEAGKDGKSSSPAAKYVWHQMRRLGRASAKDLPESFFEEAHDRLSAMLRTGWERQWTRDTAQDLDTQMFLEKLRDAQPPKHEYGKRVRGQDLKKPSLYDRAVVNQWQATADWFQKNRIALMPIDAALDELGGDPGTYSNALVGFKKKIDGHYWDMMDEEDRIIKGFDAIAKNLSLESHQRLGIVLAREQRGGMERLLARTDLTQPFIDGIKLTPEEEKVRVYIRQFMDAVYPRVEKTMAEMFNTEVRKVMNYFMWMTDVEALNDLRMEQRFQQDVLEPAGKGGAPRYPNRKFTQARGAQGMPVVINADKVFRAYVHNSLHLVNLGPALKKYQDIFQSPEFGAITGGETQSFLKDYLEVVARDGRGDPAQRRAWLDKLRANVGAGLVPFHITPALLHASKWLNAPILFGAQKALVAAGEFTANPDVREFLRKYSPEWRDRGGYDDPTLQELEFSKYLGKINRAGLVPLRAAEQWSAGCTLWAAYKDELVKRGVLKKGEMPDLANPDKEALLAATLLMRRAEGSPLAKDLPLAISAGRGLFNNVSDNRAFAQFQMFPWTRFSYITHDIPVRYRRDRIDGSFASVYMAGAYAAEMGARMTGRWVQIGLLGLLGFDTAKMIEKESKRDSEFLENYVEDIIRTIPGVGQFFHTFHAAKMYGVQKPGDVIPIASLSEPLDAAYGTGKIYYAKGERQKMAGLWTAFGAISSMLGLGALTQFATLFSKVLTGEKKPQYQSSLDRLRTIRPELRTETESKEFGRLTAASEHWETARKDLAAAYEKGDMDGMARAATEMQHNLEIAEA